VDKYVRPCPQAAVQLGEGAGQGVDGGSEPQLHLPHVRRHPLLHRLHCRVPPRRRYKRRVCVLCLCVFRRHCHPSKLWNEQTTPNTHTHEQK